MLIELYIFWERRKQQIFSIAISYPENIFRRFVIFSTFVRDNIWILYSGSPGHKHTQRKSMSPISIFILWEVGHTNNGFSGNGEE